MSLPTKKNDTDFDFKFTGQADKFGNDLGGNVSSIQQKFDARAIYNQEQINEILDALNSVLSDDSGAHAIGLRADDIVATNVAEALEELKQTIPVQVISGSATLTVANWYSDLTTYPEFPFAYDLTAIGIRGGEFFDYKPLIEDIEVYNAAGIVGTANTSYDEVFFYAKAIPTTDIRLDWRTIR